MRQKQFFPGQFGVHGSDTELGQRMDSTGCVFYVDPNHVDASDDHDGTDPDHPLATVTEALTRVGAYQNDVIAVMFNADWTYSSLLLGRATPIQENVTINTPGVKLVGIAPSGALGVPWLSTANSTTSIIVNAMDVLIEGFCFWDSAYTGTTAIYAQWSAPTYYGENLIVRNCYFYEKGYGIVLDYAWNCFIENNTFYSIDTQCIHNSSTFGEPDFLTVRNNVFMNNAGAINLPDCDSCIIEANRFLGNTTTIIMTGAASDNLIHGNVIVAAAAGANNMINLSGGVGTLNMVSDNYLSCSVAQYDTTCSPGGGGTDTWVRNHLVNGESAANPT